MKAAETSSPYLLYLCRVAVARPASSTPTNDTSGGVCGRQQRLLLKLRVRRAALHDRLRPPLAGECDTRSQVADDTLAIDGREVGFADYRPSDGIPVLWCHGGPDGRLEPARLVDAATAAGLRLIGIDRPGFGMPMPLPGRPIAGWVGDALAVADSIDIERFAAVGESTGGAYPLALAALVPERVLGVVAC